MHSHGAASLQLLPASCVLSALCMCVLTEATAALGVATAALGVAFSFAGAVGNSALACEPPLDRSMQCCASARHVRGHRLGSQANCGSMQWPIFACAVQFNLMSSAHRLAFASATAFASTAMPQHVALHRERTQEFFSAHMPLSFAL